MTGFKNPENFEQLSAMPIFGRNNRIAAAFWYVVVLGFFLSLSLYDDGIWWWIWLVAGTAIALVRFYLGDRLAKAGHEETPQSSRLYRLLHIVVLLIGMHTSVLIWFVPLDAPINITFLVLFLMPSTMGSAYALSPSVSAFYMHTLPPLLVAAARVWLTDVALFSALWNDYLTILSIAIYAVYLSLLAQSIRAEIQRAFDMNGKLGEAYRKIGEQTEDLEDLARRHSDAARRAEKASAAKSQLLANTSHELRTPMNAVLGMAQALKYETDEAERDKQIDILLQSGNILKALLNDIIDLSRIESGKSIVAYKAARLEPILQAVMSLHSYEAHDKGVQISASIDEDIPDILMLDPVRLRQCFGNLVSNAVKFTDQGQIAIEVKMVATHEDFVELNFEIRDTGIGISPSDMERIFDLFSRAETEANKYRPGAGLGLAITRSLASQMQGELDVQSEVGRGSVFSFRWTADFASAEDAQSVFSESITPVSSFDFTGCHALIAEDHVFNRTVLESFLKLVGLSYEFVGTGTDLIWKADEKEYSILLVDILMPGLSGLEAVKQIRTSGGPNAATPVIMLTATAGDEAFERSREAGADAHLTKPIDAQELYLTLHEYLART